MFKSELYEYFPLFYGLRQQKAFFGNFKLFKRVDTKSCIWKCEVIILFLRRCQYYFLIQVVKFSHLYFLSNVSFFCVFLKLRGNIQFHFNMFFFLLESQLNFSPELILRYLAYGALHWNLNNDLVLNTVTSHMPMSNETILS